MSDLRNNVTSDWIRATGFFGHTPHRISVSLFVEGDDDVPLWKEAIKPYQGKYDIRVTTNKMVNPNEGNGKDILLSMKGLGSSKVVALDADYDLLIDNYSANTEMVRSGKYVINTTWYSLENILMQKTNTISLLESFSELSMGWFMDYLQKVAVGVYNSPARKFGEILANLNIQKLAASGDFSTLKGVYSSDGSNNMKTIENKLSEMNCKGQNLWKVMRGHNLWNSIVKPVKERLLNERIKKITDQQVADGYPFDRIAAMNQLGIYMSVKDFVEVEFYNNNLDGILIPAETRSKLDSLFS